MPPKAAVEKVAKSGATKKPRSKTAKKKSAPKAKVAKTKTKTAKKKAAPKAKVAKTKTKIFGPASFASETDEELWKRPETQKFLLKVLEELLPSEDLPKWIKHKEFYTDMASTLLISLTDSLREDKPTFSVNDIAFPVTASFVDTGVSDIQNYLGDMKEEDIPDFIRDAYNEINP